MGMMDNLPTGWIISTLGEICSKPQYGWTSKASHSGTLRYVRTTDISNGKINWEKVPFCSKIPDDIKKYKIKKDDILVSRAGSVGVSYRIKKVPFDAVFASYLIRFKSIQNIDPKYIEYYLKSYEYWKSISDFTTGIAIPNVNASKLSQLKIPVAPLNEQRRIVAKLEKLLQKVDACKERLNKIPAILKRFRQSILAAACSGRLTADWRKEHPDVETASELIERIIVKRKTRYEAECADAKREGKRKPARPQRPKSLKPDYFEAPDSWDLALLYDLFSLVTSGSRGWAKYYAENGPIFLRVGNLDHDSIKLDLSSIQRVNPPKGMEGTRTKIHVGDILISITADTGMLALIKEDIGEAYINQHIALARPIGGFPKEYLAWVLASEIGQKQFKELQRGMTKAGLGLDDIRSVWIPFPPLEEQYEIVRRVEALFKIADQIEERYQKARSYVDKLTQSILAKAFRGALFPQDPNDESASELLKRIKEEQSKKETNAYSRGIKRKKKQ